MPAIKKKIEELELSKDKNIEAAEHAKKLPIVWGRSYPSQENSHSNASYKMLETLIRNKEEFDHEIDVGLPLSRNFEFLDDALESPRICEKRNVFSEIACENDNYSIKSNICLNDLY